jgi:hypothetical protein
VVGNRVRNNGRRAERGATGSGHTVSYTETSLIDSAADWLPDGHLGKWLTVGSRRAIVIANSVNELILAPVRPGMRMAWTGGTPPAGAEYSLPDAPGTRAGLTLASSVDCPTIRQNRIWDSRRPRTQTHGLWITESGSCASGWIEDNNLVGNAIDAARFDTLPSGGCWDHNHGLDHFGEPPAAAS